MSTYGYKSQVRNYVLFRTTTHIYNVGLYS